MKSSFKFSVYVYGRIENESQFRGNSRHIGTEIAVINPALFVRLGLKLNEDVFCSGKVYGERSYFIYIVSDNALEKLKNYTQCFQYTRANKHKGISHCDFDSWIKSEYERFSNHCQQRDPISVSEFWGIVRNLAEEVGFRFIPNSDYANVGCIITNKGHYDDGKKAYNRNMRVLQSIKQTLLDQYGIVANDPIPNGTWEEGVLLNIELIKNLKILTG